jgi:hypothetical protein
VIRFDSAGTELDLPPGADFTVQGQSLIMPEATEGGLTLDQRAMVSWEGREHPRIASADRLSGTGNGGIE